MLYYTVNLVLILLLIGGFYYRYRSSAYRTYFWPSYLFKCGAGIFLGWYFLSINPAQDAYLYVEDAHRLALWGLENPGEFLRGFWLPLKPEDQALLNFQGHPRAIFTCWLISPIALITGGNFWLVSVYLSTLAFMGLWTLAHKIASEYPKIHLAAFFSFMFYPSVVVWTSGVTKEAIFMTLCGLMWAHCWPYFGKFRWRWWLLLFVLVAWALFRLKYYYTAIIVPLLVSAWLVRLLAPRKTQPGIWIFGVFLILIPLASLLHPNLNIEVLAGIIQQNAEYLVAQSKAQAIINYAPASDPLKWALINSPQALSAALFRPFLGDFGSFFQNLVIIEHVVLAAFALRMAFAKPQIPWKSPWFLPMIILIISLGVCLALSTPNFGTLMRYKAVYLPFWILLILMDNPWWKRLNHRMT